MSTSKKLKGKLGRKGEPEVPLPVDKKKLPVDHAEVPGDTNYVFKVAISGNLHPGKRLIVDPRHSWAQI